LGGLGGGQGSYAEYALVLAAKAVPDEIDDDTAVAVLMQGVTAHYLATDTFSVHSGDSVLDHAAAGGVGHLLTQIVRLRGGHVVGTVSTSEKAAAATAAGVEHVLDYPDFAQQPEISLMGIRAAVTTRFTTCCVAGYCATHPPSMSTMLPVM
jgi:NADPH2:quinone reductase